MQVMAGMSGCSAVPRLSDHVLPIRTEDTMIARLGRRDPFWDDGKGARRRQLRLRVEGLLAIALAIAACGLTAAMWLRQILPVVGIQI